MMPNTWDTVVHVSDQRFRGQTSFAVTPPPGTLRIACLGDSFTFGTGVGDEETYAAYLAGFLAERYPSSGPIEVINAGIEATGTGEQALWYETWVRRFRPHLVILAITTSDPGLEDLFFTGRDTHPTPAGNRLIAKLIADRLASAGLITHTADP